MNQIAQILIDCHESSQEIFENQRKDISEASDKLEKLVGAWIHPDFEFDDPLKS